MQQNRKGNPMAAIKKLVVAYPAPAMAFYTKSGTLIASGHERVVVGKRGAYVEFSPEQVNMSGLHFVPYNEAGHRHVYFYEYRSNDTSNVMVYLQRRTVKYADYHVGMFDVAPADLEP